MDAIAGATSGSITAAEKKRRKVAPPTPFNTTALQAAAAAEGITPARTMRIAESLYMDGLISYPRVDNTVYPQSLDLKGILSALSDVAVYRDHVNSILSGGALHPTRGAKETTDHPPITPTAAADPEKLKPEEWKLYNLVARRFMATLSDPAVIEGTKVTIDVAGEPFVAKGDILVVPGFRGIYPYGLKKDEQLPALTEGDDVDFLGAELAEKQTEPPARYSQGKLIQEMEKRGLGTKATRHAIIERLIEVRYAVNEPLEPTALGRAVIDALSQFAPRITTPDMTGELEAEMDAIANGRVKRVDVVNHSRELLARRHGRAHRQDHRGRRGAARGRRRRRQGGRVPEVRPRPAHQVLRQDPRSVRGLLGMARVRRHVPAAARQDRGRRRAVPGLRHGAGQGHPVPHEAASRVSRPGVPHQPRARDLHRRLQGLRRGGPQRRPDGAALRTHAEAVRALHQLRACARRATRCRSAGSSPRQARSAPLAALRWSW